MMKMTPITVRTDSYKAGHFLMYPDAQKMSAYGSFRRPYRGMDDDRIVFYGFEALIRKLFSTRVTVADVDAAETFFNRHNTAHTPYPFPRDLFMAMIEEHDGAIPLTISALPDGSIVYPNTPVFQITAEGKYSRLITYFETLLVQVWYPSTVATLSRLTKQLIADFFAKTVDEDAHWLLESRLHDFGYRGTSCEEQAVIGGMAHLLNFDGTDTVTAAWQITQEDGETPFTGTSIPATEHSVMMSWPTELDAVQNMVDRFGDGIFACVADTYDYDAFLSDILPQVAPQVKSKGGLMVVRPDSGDPVEQVVKGLEACAAAFGFTVNEKGYKVLSNAAVIQGDGIDYFIVRDILEAATTAGFSTQNIAFGMGGGLLHKHNRDTLSFAVKLNQIVYADGTVRDVMKKPKGAAGKMSIPGRVAVEADGTVVSEQDVVDNQLRVIYHNGTFTEPAPAFSDIRARVETEWVQSSSKRNVISAALQEKMRLFTP